MWYTNPDFWASAAAVIAAVGGLITAARAKTKAADAHAIALGHALDRSVHPITPRPPRGKRPPASSPAGPSSG